MKPLILGIIITLLSFFFTPSSISAQSDTGWVVNKFKSEIVLHKDTSATITETIDVDFGNLVKHGIYRTIPVKYTTQLGNSLDIRFDLISVTDQNGKRYPVSTSYVGNDIELKIGDPDRTISGEHTYIITYSVNRVITVPDNAEFYWNVTGNDWPVPIESVRATVTSEGIKDTICFQGSLGSTDECLSSATSGIATFEGTALVSGQGMTIAVALDPNVFVFPSWQQNLLWFMRDNWVYVIPILVFIAMIRIYSLKGRDKQYVNIFHESDKVVNAPLFKRIDALSTFHPPDTLTPGEVGVIVDERVHQRDITATIIDLAVKGYLKIKEEIKGKIIKRTEFTMTLIGKDETSLKSYEVSVLDMLFGTERKASTVLSKLPKDAYKHLATVQDNLYKEVVSDGYFSGNPKSVRTTYGAIGAFIMFLSFVFGPVFQNTTYATGIVISLLVSGLIIIFFSFFMPSRTAKGRKALSEIVGLKEYIRVGAWRQKEYEKRNFFEETLPYTIAFGLVTKFIDAFKDTKFANPEWYESTKPFRLAYFAHSLSDIESGINKGVASTRPKSASSGGSGFSSGGSGGGFGGGGGGSW